MKRYITYSLLTLLLMTSVISGCKKALEEDPKTFISPDNFFKNPDSYELAVVGIYSGLPLYSGNTAMMLEMCTDIYGAPASAFEQALPMYQNAPADFYYNTREAWGGAYSIIKNANFILDELPKGPLEELKKKQLMAEARFLRAYAYFYLVQLYGDIPMPVKPITDYANLQMPRTAQTEIYKLILEDLNYAEANLPESTTAQGRVYKLVSTALLAKVYLTMGGNPLKQTQYFANAKEKAVAVINSGKFKLADDFAGVFHKTGYTSESIWEQLYVTGLGGNPVHGLTLTAATYNPILVPADWFINSFATGDRRKEWGIVQNFAGPNGTTLKPFFQKFADVSGVASGTTSSGAIVSYTFPYLRLAEMYLIAAEAENEVNGPGAAYTYINEIRKRARVDKANLTNVPDLSGLSQQQFREAAWMERKWELCLEGSTWFDLKRTNSLQNIQNRRGAGLINPIGAYNQIWLIPDKEVVNNNIAQNPVYK
ncbi:RagB/SusD family nutrient uptake outer membrane protein [Pedobacter sp. KBW06]|uniref:RagB/SusD family nutrient uptake outer membrane protein n=1 Tax=Pedobacter sp. KBW06 TaxID=2153359 RepID=UPI000F59B0FB|nr:RagB/SusD family nutrient uptake outer membrane protein [Pedobacter sp. KBW06]RQO75815.1 RagB/SusD family nutrient uptake outer membrane protein [Pedobacter sp. KBW06]